MIKFRSGAQRSNRGSITEFGPALVILVTCFIIPIADVAVLIMRYAIAQDIVSRQAHNLALTDKFSSAQSWFNNDQTFKAGPAGVQITQSEISLEALSLEKGEARTFQSPKNIPSVWLPNGSKGPLHYDLVVRKQAAISPLFCLRMPGLSVPGLTRPVHMMFEARARWQNQNKDADTGEFYINE